MQNQTGHTGSSRRRPVLIKHVVQRAVTVVNLRWLCGFICNNTDQSVTGTETQQVLLRLNSGDLKCFRNDGKRFLLQIDLFLLL